MESSWKEKRHRDLTWEIYPVPFLFHLLANGGETTSSNSNLKKDLYSHCHRIFNSIRAHCHWLFTSPQYSGSPQKKDGARALAPSQSWGLCPNL